MIAKILKCNDISKIDTINIPIIIILNILVTFSEWGKKQQIYSENVCFKIKMII